MLARTDNPAEVGLHVFERAQLGKAPFRCIGYYEAKWQAHPGAPVQPGTCCDYCGQGIINAFKIRSRDGREFKVGSDCVARTGDAGLIRSYKKHPEVRAAARAKRNAKDDAVIAEWTALIEANRAKLAAVMVPGPDWKPEPRPLLEDLERVWGMCGAAGRARELKHLKKLLAA